MRQHHAAWGRGRPGGVLKDRHISRACVCSRRASAWCQSRGIGQHLVDNTPLQPAEVRLVRQTWPQTSKRRRRGQRDARLSISSQQLDALQALIEGWRVRGHGDPAGVKAAEQRGDEVKSRRQKQQRAFARLTCILEARGNRLRPAVQLGVVDRDVRGWIVGQPGEGDALRLPFGAAPQQLSKRVCYRAGATHRSPRGWILKVAGKSPTSSPSA